MKDERKEDWRKGYARSESERAIGGGGRSRKRHPLRCDCPDCDPDAYNEFMRDTGHVYFGGNWY